MKLSKAAFEIMFDTLKGSLRIADNASIFFYAKKTREELFHELMGAMKKEAIGEIEDVKDQKGGSNE